MSQQPSGWYDDPTDPDLLRYWDGVTWTTHTAPKKSPTASQSTIGLPQQPTTPVPSGSGWQDRPGHGASGYGQGGQYPYGQQSQPGLQQTPQYQQAPGAAWMHAGPTTSDGVPLASWGRRLAAWIIDGIVIVVISGILINLLVPSYAQMLEDIMKAMDSNDREAINTIIVNSAGTVFLVALLSYLIASVYAIACWVTTAQTIGKMALRISVRRTDRPGPLDIVTAIRRRLLALLSVIPGVSAFYSIVLLLDGLWPLWDERRQTLHDKIASTQVVVGKQPRQPR
ncbi:MAG: RDD family protein [Intrasporangium sp.]|uniref:RDD family protein n=1 Tax=Intrasporangium sp. TaxID=1925024 RepID=UPI002649C912|nr:RDD family protein [Intrasporangium sp.]MDN5795205.1 RDD family protein [Intrasporangium sp.]